MDNLNSDYAVIEFEQLASRFVDAKQLTLEVLLRRGFLVRFRSGKLKLMRGSPREDISLLGQCGVILDLERRSIYLGSLIFADSEEGRMQQLRSILTHPYQNHMTGAADYMGKDRSVFPVVTGFASFKRTRFGSLVPVYCLEAGIALLVKVIPVLGCTTVMSCSGHGDRESYIAVYDEWHLRWLESCLRSSWLQIPSELLELSEFKYNSGWDGARWIIHWPPETPRLKRWNLLQVAARSLLKPRVRSLAKERRSRIISESDLM